MLLGVLFYYFSAHGQAYLPQVIYWILVAFLLVVYFEIMGLLWTRTSTIFKSNFAGYYPIVLALFYFFPTIYVIVKQVLELL